METAVISLESKRDGLLEKFYKGEDVIKRAKTNFFKKYFGNALQADDHIRQISSGYSILRSGKEMFTVYLDTGIYGSDEYRLEVNYYTCGATSSDFELGRLMTLGKVAEVIKTHGDEIKTKYKELLQVDYFKMVDGIREEIRLINQKIRDIEAQEKNRLAEAAISDFYRTGNLIFDVPSASVLFRVGRYSNPVKSLTINKVNRKTVDIATLNANGEFIRANQRVNKDDLEGLIRASSRNNNIV